MKQQANSKSIKKTALDYTRREYREACKYFCQREDSNFDNTRYCRHAQVMCCHDLPTRCGRMKRYDRLRLKLWRDKANKEAQKYKTCDEDYIAPEVFKAALRWVRANPIPQQKDFIQV